MIDDSGCGVYPDDYDASKSPNPMKTFMEGYATRSDTTGTMAAYLDDASVTNITNTELQTGTGACPGAAERTGDRGTF